MNLDIVEIMKTKRQEICKVSITEKLHKDFHLWSVFPSLVLVCLSVFFSVCFFFPLSALGEQFFNPIELVQ